jgi:hypothetical protein
MLLTAKAEVQHGGRGRPILENAVAEVVTLRTVVEGMLPARFLMQHAIYMQTCAHIELGCWHIVQVAHGKRRFTVSEWEKVLGLKKDNWKIIDGLKQAARWAPAPIGLRLYALIPRIRDGIEPRNAAAHGAWFYGDGALRVEHYFTRGRGKAAQWFHIDEPVQQRTIDAAIEDDVRSSR